MDEAEQVESYALAAAQQHLDAIDDTFVDHLLRLCGNTAAFSASPSWALDIGTGPGQIPIKILKKISGVRIVGVDRSRNMLARARQNSVAAGVADRLALLGGDGHLLPFPDHTFGMVLCNSTLHHVRDPVALLREIERVAKPSGAVLFRDLRRPSKFALPFHLWRHGRQYQGLMRKLFEDSVRAAYTLHELQEFIERSGLKRVAPLRFRGAHLGFERRAEPRRQSE